MAAESEESDFVHRGRSIQRVPLHILLALTNSSGSRYSCVVKGDKRTIMVRHEARRDLFPYDE
jgi:hypothetical protein